MSECTQCGEERAIVSIREVCRDCHKHDNRLSDAQWALYEAVLADDRDAIQRAATRLGVEIR